MNPSFSTPQNSMRSADDQLDLRGTPCPLNFVRTKLKLERMAAGTLLEVWLDAGEPIEQVPDSLTMAGYAVEQLQPRDDYFVVQVRKP
ncbi:MAG: sulfurtransferase TusA family protein [Leptolyngbya sp. SIO4C5]|nr:sulfurtransferase TusA family protein [Leptolyngbya sp. SIO4C5]